MMRLSARQRRPSRHAWTLKPAEEKKMPWTHTAGRSQPLLSERHGYMAVKTHASANSGAICALQRRETAAEAAARRRSKPASATPPMFHAPPAAPKSLAAPNTRIRPQARVETWKLVAMVIKFDRIVIKASYESHMYVLLLQCGF